MDGPSSPPRTAWRGIEGGRDVQASKVYKISPGNLANFRSICSGIIFLKHRGLHKNYYYQVLITMQVQPLKGRHGSKGAFIIIGV